MWQDPPDWADVLAYFRGSELQNFFIKMLEDNLKAMVKPQYVDQIPRATRGKGTVGQLLSARNEKDIMERINVELELDHLLEREPGALSGGELQRFAIAMVCLRDADVYMYDEPSSYLDIKQRLAAARTIRSMLGEQTYVQFIVVIYSLAHCSVVWLFHCVTAS